MKSVLAVIVLLASSAAFACPELSGNFDCQGQATLEIKQAGVEFEITTTDADGAYTQQIVADGQLRTAGPSSDYKSATQMAKCDAASLSVDTNVVGNNGEQYQELLNASMNGTSLQLAIKQSMTQNGQTQEQEGQVVCTRK